MNDLQAMSAHELMDQSVETAMYMYGKIEKRLISRYNQTYVDEHPELIGRLVQAAATDLTGSLLLKELQSHYLHPGRQSEQLFE